MLGETGFTPGPFDDEATTDERRTQGWTEGTILGAVLELGTEFVSLVQDWQRFCVDLLRSPEDSRVESFASNEQGLVYIEAKLPG